MQLGVLYFNDDPSLTNYNGIVQGYYWTPPSYSKCGSLFKVPIGLYITIYDT